MEITQKFINENIRGILERLRPDLCFEYFSKGEIKSFGNYSGWDIQIGNNSEILGIYHNGKCISGLWYDEKQEQISMQGLYNRLKKESNERKMDFGLYLNQLLCTGKRKGGISWNEYDYLIDIDKLLNQSNKGGEMKPKKKDKIIIERIECSKFKDADVKRLEGY